MTAAVPDPVDPQDEALAEANQGLATMSRADLVILVRGHRLTQRSLHDQLRQAREALTEERALHGETARDLDEAMNDLRSARQDALREASDIVSGLAVKYMNPGRPNDLLESGFAQCKEQARTALRDRASAIGNQP